MLYESHSVIHGRPFPYLGKYYANAFFHFSPTDAPWYGPISDPLVRAFLVGSERVMGDVGWTKETWERQGMDWERDYLNGMKRQKGGVEEAHLGLDGTKDHVAELFGL
ncbi:hypothetical protein TrRE_jg1429 [Triparma retinervis]|uniref:Uncharacterized protein n=1 Tax=Triparma retinervis TaxID=2557542 RepID=A0A9W6ZQD7_9STRA|nr:hypothetical protein TrRE_jg1429 [Triparma retinervis]